MMQQNAMPCFQQAQHGSASVARNGGELLQFHFSLTQQKICTRHVSSMNHAEALPETLADVPADGVAIEFGGVLPGDGGFARTMLQYGHNGRLESIRFDEFTGQT